MSKLLCGEAESCNQQETEAEQVICNQNVRGIRGSTARNLCNENMPKNSRARIFCLQCCLKVPVDFLPEQALLGRTCPLWCSSSALLCLHTCHIIWESQSTASAFSLTGPIFMQSVRVSVGLD